MTSTPEPGAASSSCGPKRTDLIGSRISYERALILPWRRGSQVGRTVYARDPETGWERLIGIMDTPRLADHVVRLHNLAMEDLSG